MITAIDNANSSSSTSVTAFHDYLYNNFICNALIPRQRCSLHKELHDECVKEVDAILSINEAFIHKLEYFYPLCTELVIEYMHNVFGYIDPSTDTYRYAYNKIHKHKEYHEYINEEHITIMPAFIYDYCFTEKFTHTLTDYEDEFIHYISELYEEVPYGYTESADTIDIRHCVYIYHLTIPSKDDLKKKIDDTIECYKRRCARISIEAIEAYAAKHSILTSSFKIYNHTSVLRYLQYHYRYESIVNDIPFNLYLTIDQFNDYINFLSKHRKVNYDSKLYLDNDMIKYTQIVLKMYTFSLDVLSNPNNVAKQDTKLKVIQLRDKCSKYLGL